MRHRPKREIFIVLFILTTAFFFRFYQLVPMSPADLYAPVLGVFTVLGLYLFTQEIFDWHIAGISSFLLAISFWHVNISRTELQATLLPFILVYVFYFIWRGLHRSNLQDFFWAGIFGGIGFYTRMPYWTVPLITIVFFVNYWFSIKKDFAHDEYLHARNRLLAGYAMFALVTFFVAIPAIIDLIKNPHGLIGNNNYHISNIPMFGWPIALFCVIGFFKELIHWLSHKHGHFSPVHTLLFSWFFILLAPQFFIFQTPTALQTFAVLPIIILFAGWGIWWIFHALEEWEMITHPWESLSVQAGRSRNQFIAPVLALFILLSALGFYEYKRVFNAWLPNQTIQLK